MAIVTSADDPLQHLFWRAYRKAGGIPPAHVFIVIPPSRPPRPLRDRVLEAYWMFGCADCLRLAAMTLRTRIVAHPDSLSALSAQNHAGRGTIHTVPALTAAALEQHLAGDPLDVLVSVGAPQIFPPSILAVPMVGSINVHNGRLPQFRGHLGTFWEIFTRKRDGYVTVHEMVAKVDSGRVLAQGSVALDEHSGLFDVLVAKKALGGRLLAEILVDVAAHRNLSGVAAAASSEAEPGYYGWPTVAQCREFSRIRRHVLKQ